MLPSLGSSVLETGIEVVLISPSETDSLPLRRLFGHSRSSVYWFSTCQAALAFLREHPVGVVISNTELPDGCWTDLLGALTGFIPPPNLIVSSRLADDRLWAQVLNLGGYDVLLTPFDPDEALRVSTSAWLAWRQKLSEVPPPRKVA
ncbi:MAG TPA: hypothetical protein VLE22_05215 [Bryobacteraceae bacterium]|nr:hypothetical protein [Bryobacteraceae bacterium]